jgi:nucleoid-associated protein YgaU
MVNPNDPSERPTARLYRVQEQDDLRTIAIRLYGLADFWVLLYGANSEVISANGGIRPGQILYVPDRVPRLD